MAKSSLKRKPGFFWQGALILLPIAVLAVAGLYSLRQDRLLAEQEAKELGGSLARCLAQVADDEIGRQLTSYCNANSTLPAIQLGELMGGKSFDEAAWLNSEAASREQMNLWQQANSNIDLAAMPTTDWNLNPREEPSSSLAASPPDWLLELSPEQRRLWQEEEQAEFASNGIAAAETAVTNFLATKPSADARANAEFHLLLLQTRALAPAAAAAQLAASKLCRSSLLTDAGLPIGQLVCYRVLRLLPDNSQIPAELKTAITLSVLSQSSILAPRLIEEVERVAGKSPSVTALRQSWESQEKAREVLREFFDQHPRGPLTNGLYWVGSLGGQFLLEFLSDPSGVPARVMIFSEAIVDKAVDAVLANAGLALPEYARATLELGGKVMVSRQNKVLTVGSSVPPPILGEAAGSFSHLPMGNNAYPFAGDAYPFHVRVLLADRDALYARQRQRTLLFGAMILASALAAVAGLFAARRAFYRQLQLNEMKSNFVSSVSHELRAPIASVRLMAENLERGKIPEAARQNQYFRFIVQECRRLSSLIENVLDFSRIEQGRKQYEFEPTDLSALARTTVNLMGPYAEEKGVKLELSALEPAPSNIELNVDGRALQQALVNLMDNAIKHSPKGESVTVGIERRNGPAPAVHLFVSDHGPGIPAEEHEKIFERFYRCGSELRRQTQGVGIGLSVVRHIVTAHGGRVIVQSSQGQGSRFTIELPGGNAHA